MPTRITKESWERHGDGWVARKGVKSYSGLGDKVENLLGKFGITQDRVKELKELAGFEPTCGCPARKYFLNNLPTRVAGGFATGGLAGAWESAKQLAKETREKFKNG